MWEEVGIEGDGMGNVGMGGGMWEGRAECGMVDGILEEVGIMGDVEEDVGGEEENEGRVDNVGGWMKGSAAGL